MSNKQILCGCTGIAEVRVSTTSMIMGPEGYATSSSFPTGWYVKCDKCHIMTTTYTSEEKAIEAFCFATRYDLSKRLLKAIEELLAEAGIIL